MLASVLVLVLMATKDISADMHVYTNGLHNIVNATEGSEPVLRCFIKGLEGGVTVEWHKSVDISQKSLIWKADSSTGENHGFNGFDAIAWGSSAELTHLQQGHSLTFRSAREEYSDVYVCNVIARNTDGTKRARVRLNVKALPVITLEFRKPRDRQYFAENEVVTLTCRSSKESTSMKIYRDRTLVKQCSDNFKGQSCIHQYQNISRLDNGEAIWRCGSLVDGNWIKSQRISIPVKFMSEELKMSSSTAMGDKDVTLKCETGPANPKPQIYWKKGGKFCLSCGKSADCLILDGEIDGDNNGKRAFSTLRFNRSYEWGQFSCHAAGNGGELISRAVIPRPDYLGGPLCASKEVVVLRDGEVTFGSGSGQVKVEVETTLDMWSFGVGIATGMCLLVFLVLVVWGIIKYKKQQRLKAIERELNKK